MNSFSIFQKIGIALCLVSFSAPLRGLEKGVVATELLRFVLSGSKQPYEGHLVVTHWEGSHSTSEDVHVLFSPPNRYRWEFLNRDGTIHRVVQSDGENEYVLLPNKNRWVRGDAIKSLPKRISGEDEMTLLSSNYNLSKVGNERVIGRNVWFLKLIPKNVGKAHQELWIDKETGVVLENKKFRPNESFGVVSRFVRFSIVPSETFDWPEEKSPHAKGQKVDENGFEPDFLSIQEWEGVTGRKFFLPEELPEGFSFESIDFFPVGNDMVNHVRYTDGLTILSVFETVRPVRDQKRIGKIDQRTSPNLMTLSLPETVVFKSSKNHFFTLMSDTSFELLRSLSESLK